MWDYSPVSRDCCLHVLCSGKNPPISGTKFVSLIDPKSFHISTLTNRGRLSPGESEHGQIPDLNHISNIDPMIQYTITILYATSKYCIFFLILSISIIFEDLKRSWFLLSKFHVDFQTGSRKVPQIQCSSPRFLCKTCEQAGGSTLKDYRMMCSFLVFFDIKKKHFSKFWISSIPSTLMMPDGFWHFPSTMRVISGPQECSEDVQSGFTSEKHDFSMENPLISPCGVRDCPGSDLSEKSMVLGRQWEFSEHLVIQFNRNHLKTSFLGL